MCKQTVQKSWVLDPIILPLERSTLQTYIWLVTPSQDIQGTVFSCVFLENTRGSEDSQHLT